MSTPAQLLANRVNSQLSTGPKTPEGKAAISLNAVKNGLTGATVLLPSDDAALYEQHIANTNAAWQPANHREKLLVQSIADTQWRLHRIPALEAAILALGQIQSSSLFDNYAEPLRSALLEAHVLEVKGRDLRNLHIQERRLASYLARCTAELKQLQQERRKAQEERRDLAARVCERFTENKLSFNPSDFGFEFSLAEIEENLLHRREKNHPRAKAA